MKWPKSKQTASAGVLFVESVVNDHGSIFHPIHQENDIGIDGFIELIDVGEASGQLLAVQIKSGDSYLAADGHGFRVPVDKAHLDYWASYMVPVVIVCYSPSKKSGAWTSVRDFIEHWNYNEKGEISAITIPDYRPFNVEEIGKGLAGLAHARADERLLIKCADKCFATNPQERRDGFDILQAHPDSRGLRITAFFAKRFILDENEETAKDALFMLGYGVGRRRWSWNPSNREECELIEFVSEICADLNEKEICRLIELSDEGPFNGPTGLGERCYDVLCCCFETAEPILDKIVRDSSLPMERRANALLMLNYGSWDELIDVSNIIMEDEPLREIMIWIFGSEEEINAQRETI